MKQFVTETFWTAALASSMCAVLVVGGCDDAAEVPPLTSVNRPPDRALPSEKLRPTTQELSLTKEESLAIVPLVATVPQSWHINADIANLTVLKGHSPHHEIRFHIALRLKLSEDQLNRMLDAARRDAAKPEEKDRYLMVDIREQNGLKVLETQKVIAGDPTLGKLLNWTIWFCDKKEDGYHIYELNLSDLSVEQYQQDRDFLRAIISSIRPARE